MAKTMIAKILQSEMKKKKISINKLAKDCGIPVSVLHGWINGTLPSAKNLSLLYKLSLCLEVPFEELLFGIKRKDDGRVILFSTTFVDEDNKYRFVVEKIT